MSINDSHRLRLRLLIYFFGLFTVCIFCRSFFDFAWSDKPIYGLFEVLAILYPLLSLIMMLSPLLVIGKSWKSWVLRGLALSFYFLCLFTTMNGTRATEYSNMQTVVRNAKPLIAAIKKFDSDNGHPPKDLSELVPKYIEAIPHSGVCCNQPYEYSVSSGPPWQLSFTMPISGFDPPDFSYYPGAEYSKLQGYERIGDWIYHP